MGLFSGGWLSPGRKRRAAEGEEPPSARGGPTYPLAALLFAPATVLETLARNLDQTTLADALPALAGTTLFAVLVWLIAAALRRRADLAAALITSVWTVGCLYYLELVHPLNRFLEGGYSTVRTLPVALAFMLLLTIAAWRWGSSLRVLHTVLTGIALVMFATPVWRAAAYELRNGDARAAYEPQAAAARILPPAPSTIGEGGQQPDIFHFVFDRYGSERMLARHYGITDPIGEYLEARGFYIARDSYSNYLKTGHSLASVFAMDYLTPLAEDPRVEGDNWHPIFKMLDDHVVGRFLRARGYEQHQYGSWWAGTYHNPTADSNRPMGFSEFNMTYLRRTMLLPVMHLLPDTPFTRRLDWDNGQCQRVPRQAAEIAGLGGGERPVYVFAHILVPHGPFPFAPDGRCLTQAEAGARGDERGYVEQIAYADAIIAEVVEKLQAEDRAPPVILIQADEGPFPDRDYSVPWQHAPAEELRIKTGILSAVYLPSGDYSAFRQDFTPVNSYRLIFNSVFGTEFEELPDRIFAFPDDREIYEFHDVTDRVRCEAALASSPLAGSQPPGC